MFNSYTDNTLEYYPDKCVGCGMCWNVCPHAVFGQEERKSTNLLMKAKTVAKLERKEACMECGACQLNCPSGAIKVQSGVGCAAAMIRAALTGGPEVCGDGGCCGSSTTEQSCGCGEKK
ncbi:mercury methylation ferredoxin HgcB [Methanocella arvoryzae]|uniref:2(4Fe-4S) ferredoxin-domain protein n=1 Tax=Methanocella arvoryzae (strain DSM 22066 / NBRC 105507 / MRE50) TaxID=351160 RepID=Q0W2F7_METAR|nr:mercury methylation ferredoxin HgcB [Methanocella arvoryzae]CAJ37436.1 2(4Fe-4S) ferredoxin-domain protein [Methanocella arvoryzae MRE50]